jgi:hypothetical protein
MGIRFELTGKTCFGCSLVGDDVPVYDSGLPEEGYYCPRCMGWQIEALVKKGAMRVYQHHENPNQILALEYTDMGWN